MINITGKARIAIGLPDDIATKLFRTFPECDWWEVRGERIVRGRLFQPDAWRYVYLGEMRWLTEIFTAELLDCIIGGEATVFAIVAHRGVCAGQAISHDGRCCRCGERICSFATGS